MTCLPMSSRVSDLKRRFQGLKDEAEAAVSNIKCIVNRGKSLVMGQESIHDTETFLKKYPLAVADLDVLVNNLVRFNCELELALSKCSVIPQLSSDDSSNCEFNPRNAFPVETRSVFTNTEPVIVSSLLTENLTSLVYKIEQGSILEMKHLLGDSPSEFWLGYYSNEESQAIHLKLMEHLKLGQCKPLVSLPSIGQYIIGRVFRGYVLSVYSERIVALDIDSGIVRFTSVGEAWEMEEKFLNIPPQAICCTLWQFPCDLEWCSELQQIFKKFMSNCDLVVTVKDIIPTTPPTFVVDLDAYEGTMLNFNVGEWIMDYVLQCVVKLQLFDLCDSRRQSVFHEIDPYSVFCGESDEKEESILSNHCENIRVSTDGEFPLQSDSYQNLIDSCDTEPNNDSSDCIEDACKSSLTSIVHSSSSFNTTCIESGSNVSSEGVKDIQSFIGNTLEPNLSSTDLLSNDHMDTSSLPYVENSKLSPVVLPLVCKDDDEDKTHCTDVEESSEEEERCESARVKCVLEKGTFSDMFYVNGDDPWNFILSLNVNEEYKYIMKEIGERGKANKLQHFVGLPEINDFAIGKFKNFYFRVRICGSLQDCDDYFVLNIDTGEHKVLNIFDIFVLEEEFASLPARTINCSLWHIPREAPYWNSMLATLFGEVLQETVLKVTVKDVIKVSNSWNHLVQVKISSGVDFDLSEWLMLHVMPKLFCIKKMDCAGEDCSSVVKMLDPVNCYSKAIVSETKQGKSLLVLNDSTNSKLFSEWLRKSDAANEAINSPSPSNSSFVISDKRSHPKSNDTEPFSPLHNEEINVKEIEGVNNAIMKLGSSDNLTDFISTSDFKTGEKYCAYLSNVLSPSEFYVHLVTDDNSNIDEFQSKLQEFYSGQIISYKTKAEVKQLISNCCAAYYDRQWCRAKVIDWMDYSKNDVYLFIVDFGIYVSLPFNAIQYLKSEFYQHPLFALKCKMAQITPPNNCSIWPEDTKQYFSSILNFDNIYTLYIEGTSECGATTVFLSMKDDAESINDKLVNEGVAVCLQRTNLHLKSEMSHAIVYPPPEAADDMFSSEDECDDGFEYSTPNADIYFDDNSNNLPSVGEEMTVVITELVSLCSFYGVVNVRGEHLGRLSDTNDVLRQMSEKIERAVDSGKLRRVKNCVLGAIIVAKFSQDNTWYRARLLTPVDDSGFAEVYFVDYGNTDLVSKKHLREISKDFSSLPFQAVKFFIDGIDLTTFKGNALAKCMKVMSSLVGKYVIVRVVKIINDEIFVELFSDGNNIGSKLLSVKAKEKDDFET